MITHDPIDAKQMSGETDVPDFKAQRRPSYDRRSVDEIKNHYLIEKELSNRLRKANQKERIHLYTTLYDEFCERVPSIPGWNEPLPPDAVQRAVRNKVEFLSQFVDSESTYLELGPGDCALALAMAERVKQVYAVDVSTEITRKVDPPANFQLVISNGVSVDAPAGSVDLAYSSNLMEHLHPDDAAEQLKNLVRTLKPGGAYICITPSGLSGPHDVSKYFDETPTGFHLREYSTTELAQVLRQAGFARVRPYFWAKQKLIFVPLIWVIVLEKLLSWLPKRVCRRICRRMPFKLLVGRVIAYMPKATAN